MEEEKWQTAAGKLPSIPAGCNQQAAERRRLPGAWQPGKNLGLSRSKENGDFDLGCREFKLHLASLLQQRAEFEHLGDRA